MATKGAKKSGSTKNSTKKRSATATEIKKEREQQQVEPAGGGQLKAILLFALAVLVLFLVIIKGQSLWNIIHNFLFGIFGISVFLLPIFLGFVAVVSAMGKMSSALTVKTVESSLLVVFLSAAIDVFSAHPENQTFSEHISAAYKRGVEGGGGGSHREQGEAAQEPQKA